MKATVTKALNSPKFKSLVKDTKRTFSGRNMKDAIENKRLTGKLKEWGMPDSDFKHYNNLANGHLAKQTAKTGLAFGGAGALAATPAAIAANAIKKKKENKELSEKAAELHDYAIRKIAACEEMYNDAISDQDACIEVLAEAGLYDENGFNKEASESSVEAAEFTSGVSGVYEESLLKIAAAKECYSEAVEVLSNATEVLAELGYEL